MDEMGAPGRGASEAGSGLAQDGTQQARPKEDTTGRGTEAGGVSSVSIALVGSGGAGVVTAGEILLQTAAKAGYYGLQTRSVGPQIRGGESAAQLRLATQPVDGHKDSFDLLIAVDWQNVERYADEIPLGPDSLVVTDPKAGPIPERITAKGARSTEMTIDALAKSVPGGRPNMIIVGAVAALIGLPEAALRQVIEERFGRKGSDVAGAALATAAAGAKETAAFAGVPVLAPPLPRPRGDCGDGSADCEPGGTGSGRWLISGNQATGLGALKGGVRFVAAYPITPATEILEWLAPQLPRMGGELLQVEDELASINALIGASYAGVPAMTATSGPGLSLMLESLGLAVASETPVLVVDVQRGGPSTGIPTKTEQSDLNIALYGLHGDAPHLVVAPISVADCAFTTQWAVHLCESLQTACILLSDQYLGQCVSVVDRPADIHFPGGRLLAKALEPEEEGEAAGARYQRYKVTASGISPMSVPGMAGGAYVADGLEHNEGAVPSSQAAHHIQQLDKRADKLTTYDFGQHWAHIEGEGEIAVVTWGSATGPVREAVANLAARGLAVRLIAPRLLSPPQPRRLAEALQGVRKILVVEQNHSGQFYHYLRAWYDIEAELHSFRQPGPLLIRPAAIEDRLLAWS